MKNIFLAIVCLLGLNLFAQNDAQPKSGPSPTVNIGKPQYFELVNGLKVMVVENHKLPRVAFHLTLDNPPYLEGNKKGVANLTSALMGSGSETITKAAFDEEIDFLGADIHFSNSGASASGLSKYSKRILELMAEGALHTVFTQTEFDKEKSKLIESLKATEKSVPGVSRRVENLLSYGKSHPFGEFMTEATINNITLNDVILNYNTYFVPENAYLVVVGDVDFHTLKPQIETLFGPWLKASAPNNTYTSPKDLQYTQIAFVDMPNAVQSEISVMNPALLKMSDKDYFAVIVANQILGGDYNSYLMSNLREKHGWTYGAGSNLSASKYPTRFIAYSQVRNAVTDSAVVETLNEIKRIRTQKVTDTELKNVKASYIGQFVMDTEKPQAIAGYALRIKTQQLPEDFYENYIKNINAVTAEDVQRVANQYFHPETARILVVGKGEEILPSLEKLKIPIFYFDKYGAPTEKPNYKRAVPTGATAKSVIEKYIEAIGGEKALRNVKSIVTISSGTIQGAPVELTSKTTASHKQMREIKVMGMSMMKQVVNDKIAYVIQQGQRKEITGEDLKQMRQRAVPFDELELLNQTGLTLEGIEVYNDADTYILKDEHSKYYYDVKSGLKVAETKSAEMGGQQLSLTTSFSDYREINGIKIPYVTNLNIGMEILLTTTDVKINENIPDAEFE
ncbi:insulinase family protein [Flavobacterium sp. CYK-4]|uniref:insulinase family protein n=1 Tax=Flavobacterium lotistagni TaxID=2709660 RepID=UPI00140E78E6|nr:insulinase family protein [Flavobacterium lotistagni]NHM05920.1 insulinase family protein [Flavobacterium lotistagni]